VAEAEVVAAVSNSFDDDGCRNEAKGNQDTRGAAFPRNLEGGSEEPGGNSSRALRTATRREGEGRDTD
jgi:hypothetical protein